MAKKRILIVDDSQYFTDHLKAFFEQVMNCEVVATGQNGCQAVELFEHYRPDLLTLDIVMPGMEGSTAVAAIIAKHPDAAIVIISANRHSDAILDCLQLGALSYLEKPLKFNDPQAMSELHNFFSDLLSRARKS